MASTNGTEGRVYGGDCELIHVQDGRRAFVGQEVAEFVDTTMRNLAVASGTRTAEQAWGADEQDLCPGCYMVVLVNCARELAARNGQPIAELGRSLSAAFAKLAEDEFAIEEIAVLLD